MRDEFDPPESPSGCLGIVIMLFLSVPLLITAVLLTKAALR